MAIYRIYTRYTNYISLKEVTEIISTFKTREEAIAHLEVIRKANGGTRISPTEIKLQTANSWIEDYRWHHYYIQQDAK